MSIKIHSIPLDKEAWENIPSLVFKSFNAFSTNMTNIKKWADKHEDRLKSEHEHRKELESRADASEAALRATQGRLQDLSDEVQALVDGHRKEAEDLGLCLQTLLRTSSGLLDHLGAALGAPEDPLGLEGPGSRLGSPPSPAWGDLEEREGPRRPESGLGEASSPDLDGAPDVSGTDEASPSPDGGSSPSPLPPGAAGGLGANTAELRADGIRLSAQLEGMRTVFDDWSRRRQAEHMHRGSMQASIDDLRLASERTRERLMTWREMLKESGRALDALGHSLSSTQDAVRELQDTQVRKTDVEEAVDARAGQLQELLDGTERRMDGLVDRVAQHEADMEGLLREARRQTDEHFERHGLQVSQMVERNINPINAYLNTMHVKADTVRRELDTLNVRVPKLAAQIDGVAGDLQRVDADSKARSDVLSGRQDALSNKADDLRIRTGDLHSELSGALESLQQDLATQLAALRESVLATAEALDTLRGGDVAGLSRDLSTLEQKVARWVHAHPLPAKVSEARLYSLEARLADETEARLKFEQEVVIRSARGPRTSDPNALPQLPASQPWDGGAAGRSPMYDAYRQQHSARKGMMA